MAEKKRTTTTMARKGVILKMFRKVGSEMYGVAINNCPVFNGRKKKSVMKRTKSGVIVLITRGK